MNVVALFNCIALSKKKSFRWQENGILSAFFGVCEDGCYPDSSSEVAAQTSFEKDRVRKK